MANTRRFGYTVRLDSGLIIPAGAAANRTLVSDAEGNATWKQRIASAYKLALTENKAIGTLFEPSATKDVLVIASFSTGKTVAASIQIFVGGVELPSSEWVGKTVGEKRWITFIVPAGVRWEWKSPGNEAGSCIVQELAMT